MSICTSHTKISEQVFVFVPSRTHVMRNTEGFPFPCLGLQTASIPLRTVFNSRLRKMEAKEGWGKENKNSFPLCHSTWTPLKPAVFTLLRNWTSCKNRELELKCRKKKRKEKLKESVMHWSCYGKRRLHLCLLHCSVVLTAPYEYCMLGFFSCKFNHAWVEH